MEKKELTELWDKVYNEIHRMYHDGSDPSFETIEDAIDNGDGTGTLYINDMPGIYLDSVLADLGINKDDLTEEEYDEMLDAAGTAETDAYEDNLDSFKENGYDVDYEWHDIRLEFSVTKEIDYELEDRILDVIDECGKVGEVYTGDGVYMRFELFDAPDMDEDELDLQLNAISKDISDIRRRQFIEMDHPGFNRKGEHKEFTFESVERDDDKIFAVYEGDNSAVEEYC